MLMLFVFYNREIVTIQNSFNIRGNGKLGQYDTLCLDDTNDNTSIASASNSRMTILPNGNVGIGTTSQHPLHVTGSGPIISDSGTRYQFVQSTSIASTG